MPDEAPVTIASGRVLEASMQSPHKIRQSGIHIPITEQALCQRGIVGKKQLGKSDAKEVRTGLALILRALAFIRRLM